MNRKKKVSHLVSSVYGVVVRVSHRFSNQRQSYHSMQQCFYPHLKQDSSVMRLSPLLPGLAAYCPPSPARSSPTTTACWPCKRSSRWSSWPTWTSSSSHPDP